MMTTETQLPLTGIILAAGKGTRMRSDIPKVLHKVCGQNLLHRSVEALAALGPKQIVVVIGSGKELVLKEIECLQERFKGSITLTPVEQTSQLGTGDAAKTALSAVEDENSNFLLMPGDIPLLSGRVLNDAYQQWQKGATELLIVTAKPESAFGFGRIIRDDSNSVLGIVEEKDCTDEQRNIREINSSVYLGKVSYLKETLPLLSSENSQKEYYLTDIVALGVEKSRMIDAHCVADPVSVLGANNRLELSELETVRRREIIDELMKNGVTFEDPNAVYIDEGVTIGTDSYIGAGSRIKGNTSIGSNVTIEGDSLIQDSSIADGAHLKLGCYITSSKVGKNAQLGPFAQLRPESELADGVKIGNFVEIKKSKLGTGAKVNHLSYVGDAQIGRDVNIGAGTITANYDGVKKSKTTIGDGASTGSNSVLVAPVEVGANAYIGAGSVITKNVPEGALAVARATQKVKEGWANKRKQK